MYKNFTICTYKGSIEKVDEIVELTTTVEENIDKVKAVSGDHLYVRGLLLSDKARVYDFGSHSQFVAVMEGVITKKDFACRYNEIWEEINSR